MTQKVFMLSVVKQTDGTWRIDDDGPLLDGDDFVFLEDVEHLPRERGVVDGKDVEIIGGYVRANDVAGEAPPDAPE